MRILLKMIAVALLAGCAADENADYRAKSLHQQADSGDSWRPRPRQPAASLAKHRGNAIVVTPAAATVDSKAYQGCMDLWDPRTHMSQTEWQNACQRTAYRTQELRREAEERGRAWKRQ